MLKAKLFFFFFSTYFVLGCAGLGCCGGLSVVSVSGGCPLAVVHCLPGTEASHCGGFSSGERGLYDVQTSVVAARGLHNCGPRA